MSVRMWVGWRLGLVPVIAVFCLGLSLSGALVAPRAVAAVRHPLPAALPAGVAADRPPDQSAALASARRTGQRVEVASLTTETRRVYADPSGAMTLEQHSQPVRVRTAGG